MRRSPLLAAALAAVAFGAVGCGGNDSQQLANDAVGGKAEAGKSLFEAKNLEKAMSTVKDKVGNAKVSVLKIEPKSVKATVVDGNQPKVLVANGSGDIQTLNVPADIGGAFGTVDLSQVDINAPEKIIKGLSDEGATLDNVDYLALSGDPITKKVVWHIFLQGGKGPYVADLDGSNAKSATSAVPSTSGGSTPATPSTSGGGSAPAVSVPDANKLQECIANAGADAAKAAACATGG